MLRKILKFINGIISQLFIFFIKLYQYLISPLLVYFFGPTCRYEPTCSNYAIISFKNYPFWIAIFISIKRILRCHPFKEGGFDPVPEKVEFQLFHKKFSFLSKEFKNKVKSK